MKIAIYHNLPSGGGKRALYEMTRRLAQQRRALSEDAHLLERLRLGCPSVRSVADEVEALLTLYAKLSAKRQPA